MCGVCVCHVSCAIGSSYMYDFKERDKGKKASHPLLPGGFSFLDWCLSHTKCPLLGSMPSTGIVFSPILLAWGQRVGTGAYFSSPA